MIKTIKNFQMSKREGADLTLLSFAFAILLLWPALVNGGPFWFPDTSTYIRGADAAMYAATGQKSEWSNRIDTVASLEAGKQPTSKLSPGTRSAQESPVVLAGRSIYYGALVFLPMFVLGPWAAACVQSLITAFAIIFSIRIVVRNRVTPDLGKSGQVFHKIFPYLALGIIAATTPLAYYTNMLMPDVFAGLLCLILSVMIIFWHEMNRLERIIGIGLSCAFATFHTTILLLAIIISGAVLVLHHNNQVKIRAVMLGFLITVISVLSSLLFAVSVEKFTGQTPMTPPFLTARITAAGPGTEYLNRHCNGPNSPFAICRHVKKLPMDSDSFLWGEGSEAALFKVLSASEQRQVASEDKRFYLAVLADSPFKVIASAMSNGAEVLSRFGLENFNYPHRVLENAQEYPPNVWKDVTETRAALDTMPVKLIESSSIVVIILSLISILGILIINFWKKIHVSPNVIQFTLLICAAVLANAMICGALSKPHSRYQARLIWLLPIAATLLVSASRHSRGRQDPESDNPLTEQI